MKASEILKENIDRSEDDMIRELAKEMKIEFAKYLTQDDLCDGDEIDVKDLILKLDKIEKAKEITDDDVEFLSEYLSDDDGDEDDDELTEDETLSERAIMRRRDISLKRVRHREYLAKKSKVKNTMKRFRRTGKYARYKIRSKRYAKFEKTASGKRKTKWINNV